MSVVTPGFVARRAASGLAVLFVVVSVTFFALRAVPGGPYDREKALPDAVLANLQARADLDRPVVEQYARYLGRLAQGDLDHSMKYPNQSVAGIIRRAFPVSAVLGGCAGALALLGGVLVGAIAAVRAGGWFDRASTFATAAAFSLPSFVLGAALVMLVSQKLGWLPPALWGTPAHVVLPALTLAIAPGAWVARLTRSGLLDELGADYVRTARAKGAAERVVVTRHALRNALGPVVTIAGPLLAWLITGSFVVEQIFAIPGLGRYFVTAVIDRDYSLVLGVTVFFSALVIAANLVVDIVYAWLDPRTRDAA